MEVEVLAAALPVSELSEAAERLALALDGLERAWTDTPPFFRLHAPCTITLTPDGRMEIIRGS